MAYLEDYNQIKTDAGYLIQTPERIRQYLEIVDFIIVRTGAKSSDPEYNKLPESNVFCYDRFGKLIWDWEDREIATIKIKNGKLVLFNPSMYGYEFFVDVKTGQKQHVNIRK
ncbi:MAG: hypothetical protein GY816_20715 [Cytophagales bacterium]|nr:hypothetical protein [Cytophagales bacterium]